YVGPSVDEIGGNVPSPAISEEPIAISVADLNFEIPANYTVFPRDRRGGARDEVWLYALWPTLSGYAPSRRVDFIENPADTRRIDILIAVRTSPFTERERIDILYMPQTIDRRGARTPHQLIKYEFKEQRANVPTSGYAGSELYLGEDEKKNVIALFCMKERDDMISPECWRELELNSGVTLTYRFKRPYLAEWRKIDSEVRSFVDGLKAK
ncbi:MAG: hypothetical protein ACOZAA_04345, partial [Pseudomonadota bacterium]